MVYKMKNLLCVVLVFTLIGCMEKESDKEKFAKCLNQSGSEKILVEIRDDLGNIKRLKAAVNQQIEAHQKTNPSKNSLHFMLLSRLGYYEKKKDYLNFLRQAILNSQDCPTITMLINDYHLLKMQEEQTAVTIWATSNVTEQLKRK
jgi:hypothetical protein